MSMYMNKFLYMSSFHYYFFYNSIFFNKFLKTVHILINRSCKHITSILGGACPCRWFCHMFIHSLSINIKSEEKENKIAKKFLFHILCCRLVANHQRKSFEILQIFKVWHQKRFLVSHWLTAWLSVILHTCIKTYSCWTKTNLRRPNE